VSRKSRKDFRAVNGILLLDKSVGDTSNRALQQARHLFKALKAGHTGSLDPLASGLLPICFGEATKLSQYLIDADKRYQTVFRLGEETTTGDAEGEVIDTVPVNISRAQLDAALETFSGEIRQVPPMYSALKKNGQPLYKLARKGVEIEREARLVKILEIRVIDFSPPDVTLDVHCSKGFYIRSLAVDLGRVLGCGARVETLRRSAVGDLRVEDACSIDQLGQMEEAERMARLLPVERALDKLPSVSINSQAAKRFRQGQSVHIEQTHAAGIVSVFVNEKDLLGLGELKLDGVLQPKRLLNLP
jgi:tRNA pseudouridine55 synthase